MAPSTKTKIVEKQRLRFPRKINCFSAKNRKQLLNLDGNKRKTRQQVNQTSDNQRGVRNKKQGDQRTLRRVRMAQNDNPPPPSSHCCCGAFFRVNFGVSSRTGRHRAVSLLLQARCGRPWLEVASERFLDSSSPSCGRLWNTKRQDKERRW